MISLFDALLFAFIIFFIGLTSLMIFRNLLFMLISLEIMMNAIVLSFVLISHYWYQSDGQIMYILSITLSAVEASISLILLLQCYWKNNRILHVEKLSEIHNE
ncbi:NADH-quinone oxidoreductase subunit NuoK [Buchnera aphidicola]|uniref:NADH-quinone oxidoreductase subunit K n=1 Tax=Buchnera aphidicola (Stegophylla sp.) TaxID=2315800 RepID=A0A4D6YKD9_9GAMM|nr:NADH-quinone oxidoreductase subunit NuoK [Buchnera aphidicola (Stegophylla sp.)]QCI26300.1 NADH-quinone oxidoreductase subunit NuoK [Buchnera aphidicola (Stegophylla sp.)]